MDTSESGRTSGQGGLAGKVVVITGGGRGIGRAIARRLAREGADVALCARSREEIDAVADELKKMGRRTLAVPADVTRWEQVKSFAERVAGEFGRVDILVNNAGGGVERNTPIAESDPDTWWRGVEVNLQGTYLVTRAFLEHVDEDGKIINIGSGMGHEVPRGGNSSYNVAKAGVHMFTRALAVEIWQRGVQVNEILPGPVANGLDPEARLEESRRNPPPFASSERLKHPDQVADLVLWLATRGEDGPTGQTFSLARRPL
ncbi:MAG TPA: SDR family oxidoreductase [Chloroflexota bacterium]|nr:SDR family oxidoreductase [Chloroflexota bacterium]